jgi:hypothetical protein
MAEVLLSLIELGIGEATKQSSSADPILVSVLPNKHSRVALSAKAPIHLREIAFGPHAAFLIPS